MNGDFVNNVKKIVAVLGAGLLLFVTGCSSSSSNAAATIGKTVIPISTLQGTVSEIIKERSKVDTEGLTLATGEELNVNSIRFHIISVLFDDIAEKIKIKVTDADLAARRADIFTQIGTYLFKGKKSKGKKSKEKKSKGKKSKGKKSKRCNCTARF